MSLFSYFSSNLCLIFVRFSYSSFIDLSPLVLAFAFIASSFFVKITISLAIWKNDSPIFLFIFALVSKYMNPNSLQTSSIALCATFISKSHLLPNKIFGILSPAWFFICLTQCWMLLRVLSSPKSNTKIAPKAPLYEFDVIARYFS